MSLLIKNARLVLKDKVAQGNLLIKNNLIAQVDFSGTDLMGKNLDSEWKELEATGLYLLPGFIDIHYHGLFIFPSPERIEKDLLRMADMLLKRGVLGFLACFPACEVELLCDCLNSLKEAQGKLPKISSRLLGVYLEGPFLSKSAKGAQPEQAILDYDPQEAVLDKILSAGNGLIKVMTIAPEKPYAKELVEVLLEHNIKPALGHTKASYEIALKFCDLGACHLTHLFNAMSGIHHRTPGVALAGLIDERFTKEVIVDGYHLHPAVVRLIWRLSPIDRFILITDFVGDEEPFDEKPPMINEHTLAGSRLRLIRAIKNLMRFAGAELNEAVACASANPARFLGEESRGEIEKGFQAELVLADENLEVKKIIIGEEVVEV